MGRVLPSREAVAWCLTRGRVGDILLQVWKDVYAVASWYILWQAGTFCERTRWDSQLNKDDRHFVWT